MGEEFWDGERGREECWNGEGKDGVIGVAKRVWKAFSERTSVSSSSALSGSLASSCMSSASLSVFSLSALSGSLATPPISFLSASTVSPFAQSPRFCRYPSQLGLDLQKSINPTFFHALTSRGASFANIFADIHVVSL